MNLQSAEEIIAYLSNSVKKTPVKVYIKGDVGNLIFPEDVQAFMEEKTGVIFGDWSLIQPVLEAQKYKIVDYVV